MGRGRGSRARLEARKPRRGLIVQSPERPVIAQKMPVRRLIINSSELCISNQQRFASVLGYEHLLDSGRCEVGEVEKVFAA